MPPAAPTYSPAALALMAAGVTLARLGEALGRPKRTVSRWLQGRHPAPPELWGAIAALGGRDLADEVRQLVEAQRLEPSA